MTKSEAETLLADTAAKLGEHFDAVQIFATWCDHGCTIGTTRGTGNWYARQGLAHEFIQADIAQENAMQLAARLRSNREDGP